MKALRHLVTALRIVQCVTGTVFITVGAVVATYMLADLGMKEAFRGIGWAFWMSSLILIGVDIGKTVNARR